MKKLLLILGLSVVALSGCEEVGYHYKGTPFVVIKELSDSDRLIRDTDTGCIYFRDTNNGIIFPYYDKDGQVMGCGDKRKGADLYN